jgi:hypothetical protein
VRIILDQDFTQSYVGNSIRPTHGPKLGTEGCSNLTQGYQSVCNLADGFLVGHSRSHFLLLGIWRSSHRGCLSVSSFAFFLIAANITH